MEVLVRYLSKLGHTKDIAFAIATALDTNAISITDEKELKTHADILFLGGAPYANIMDPKLKEYAKNLKKENVGIVVLFTTSNWSRRTIYALRKILNNNGIKVYEDYFYAHMLNIENRIPKAMEFAKNVKEKIYDNL